MLLEAGSDPNIQDSLYGRTASHYAAHCKQSDILELLMECGRSHPLLSHRDRVFHKAS